MLYYLRHIPFGVLIDNIIGLDYNLPIYIIVHFKGLPDNVIEYKGKESLKFYYMNSLKEVFGKLLSGFYYYVYKFY